MKQKISYKKILRKAMDKVGYSNEFIQSCCTYYVKHGKLTVKQIKALKNIKEYDWFEQIDSGDFPDNNWVDV